MENVDMKKLAGEVVEGLKDLKEEAVKVKSIADAIKIVPEVIKKVEVVAKDVKMAGAEKKELAVAILNILIDIPFVPEAMEGMIISFAIDAAVAALNRLFGKQWLTQVA
jgi:hypothetical protein